MDRQDKIYLILNILWIIINVTFAAMFFTIFKQMHLKS